MYIKEELDINDFINMQELEKKFYDESHITPYNEVYRWYKKNKYTVCMMEDNNKVVGFINMFPIKDNVFESLKSGEFNDKDLVLEDIVDIKDKSYDEMNIFLCCVVIDIDYRNTEALNILLKENIKYYEEIKHKVKYIITDNVTLSGEKFSKRLGFEKITNTKYNSSIYLAKYSDFIKSV